MATEERPLPPEPWRIEDAEFYNGWIVADVTDQALAVCWRSGCGDMAEAVASLFAAAPRTARRLRAIEEAARRSVRLILECDAGERGWAAAMAEARVLLCLALENER